MINPPNWRNRKFSTFPTYDLCYYFDCSREKELIELFELYFYIRRMIYMLWNDDWRSNIKIDEPECYERLGCGTNTKKDLPIIATYMHKEILIEQKKNVLIVPSTGLLI